MQASEDQHSTRHLCQGSIRSAGLAEVYSRQSRRIDELAILHLSIHHHVVPRVHAVHHLALEVTRYVWQNGTSTDLALLFRKLLQRWSILGDVTISTLFLFLDSKSYGLRRQLKHEQAGSREFDANEGPGVVFWRKFPHSNVAGQGAVQETHQGSNGPGQSGKASFSASRNSKAGGQHHIV